MHAVCAREFPRTRTEFHETKTQQAYRQSFPLAGVGSVHTCMLLHWFAMEIPICRVMNDPAHVRLGFAQECMTLRLRSCNEMSLTLISAPASVVNA